MSMDQFHHLSSVPESDVLPDSALDKDGDQLFVPPSPIVTKRMRRDSLSDRAAKTDTKTGEIVYFCRQRGHGFIKPANGGDKLFVHVSDIDGEYVPHHGDIVYYKECLIPPKMEKIQAVHVTIRDLNPGVKHETWSEPPTKST